MSMFNEVFDVTDVPESTFTPRSFSYYRYASR